MQQKELKHHGVKGMKWGKHLTSDQLKEATNDVIKGKYGNGSARRKVLGEHYKEIQDNVNKTLFGDKKQKELDEESLAKDVIKGKYGNGAARRKSLGKNYEKVQNRVNEILKVKRKTKVLKASKHASNGKKAAHKVLTR